MKPQVILGVVLLLIGGILMFFGISASHSIVDQVSNTFTGRFTQATTWYIIGGGALALFGALLVLLGGGKAKA